MGDGVGAAATVVHHETHGFACKGGGEIRKTSRKKNGAKIGYLPVSADIFVNQAIGLHFGKNACAVVGQALPGQGKIGAIVKAIQHGVAVQKRFGYATFPHMRLQLRPQRALMLGAIREPWRGAADTDIGRLIKGNRRMVGGGNFQQQ